VKRFLRARIAGWARRRQGADTLPVAIHYRRIYILPTRAGWGFAFLLFCMFIAGLNYSNSTALFLTFRRHSRPTRTHSGEPRDACALAHRGGSAGHYTGRDRYRRDQRRAPESFRAYERSRPTAD
jgi:uncharacterized protein (DUF58 family)